MLSTSFGMPALPMLAYSINLLHGTFSQAAHLILSPLVNADILSKVKQSFMAIFHPQQYYKTSYIYFWIIGIHFLTKHILV